MIQIKLDFDDTLLKEYETRNSPPFFGISFQYANEFYPSENWTDFGAVILSWWVVGLVHLLGQGRCQQFMFMDGPYEVEVRHRRLRQTSMMELRPEGLDAVWKVTPIELAEALIDAGETVVQKLLQLGTSVQIRSGLELALAELRQAIQGYDAKAKKQAPKLRPRHTSPVPMLAGTFNT